MSRKFQRKTEDFVCENCGAKVQGNGYTNHCPDCLFSKHVDNFPGDRENDCGGLMEPKDIEKEGEIFYVVQICQKCGFQKRNKILPNDNQKRILEIMREKADDIWKN